jgi:pheromone shutdown protein TraB
MSGESEVMIYTCQVLHALRQSDKDYSTRHWIHTLVTMTMAAILDVLTFILVILLTLNDLSQWKLNLWFLIISLFNPSVNKPSMLISISKGMSSINYKPSQLVGYNLA